MIKLNSNNALHCPVYYAVKQDNTFVKQNLEHLNEYTHFADDFKEKPVCKYGNKCKSFLDLQNGGTELSDMCHLKLFRHPPRTQHIKLSENMHSFIAMDLKTEAPPFYQPKMSDEEKYNYNKQDGFLWALVQEVIENGYKMSLCIEPSYTHENEDDLDAPNQCEHDIQTHLKKAPHKTLLKIVDEKMKHIRHKQLLSPLNRGQMLSLTLYTGCDCFISLCSAQRNGDYIKWKWFDNILHAAICTLSNFEMGVFTGYTGLYGVKLDEKELKEKRLVTYTSTSWKIEVAKKFMRGNGMIIQINAGIKKINDKNYTVSVQKKQFQCCDVSWISKFPDECEILFARQGGGHSTCNLSVIEDSNDIQMVLLQPQPWDADAYFRRTFLGQNRINYNLPGNTKQIN